MAASVKLSELRTRVRELADMEASTPADHFVDNDELDRAINRALKRLYDKLIKARGDDYYATSTSFPTVADRALYNTAFGFPADFYQLLTVIAFDGTNTYYDVPRWGYKDLGELKLLESSSSAGLYTYRYRLVGNAIEIRPTPQTAGHTIELHYIPAMPELVADVDKFDGVNGWEDWACYTAAIDLLNKEESFEQAAALTNSRLAVERDIIELAGARDAGEAPQVQDARKDRWDYLAFNRNNWNL